MFRNDTLLDERDQCQERTALRRGTSRANGTRFGRPKKVADTVHIATARRMKLDGHTGNTIAKYLGVSRATLYRYLVEAAWPPQAIERLRVGPQTTRQPLTTR